MQGLIICYSTTGNTRLVAQRIGAALGERGVNVELRDPVRQPEFRDLGSFDFVGFGTPTMAWKPAWGFFECLGLLPRPPRPTPSFVFCTSGGLPVNTLRLMAQAVSRKNFVTLDGIEVAAETNWPVTRQLGVKGQGLVGKPDETELEAVPRFADRLLNRLTARNVTPKLFDFRLSPLHFIGKAAGPRELRRAMGTKRVDERKCTQCATCALACAARAISLRPYPVFSNRCMGCWSCYNNCPAEAISTTVTGTRGRYQGPSLKA